MTPGMVDVVRNDHAMHDVPSSSSPGEIQIKVVMSNRAEADQSLNSIHGI